MNDEHEVEYTATAPIGHQINAIAQAELAVAEAEGMPVEVQQRLDALIDRLARDAD